MSKILLCLTVVSGMTNSRSTCYKYLCFFFIFLDIMNCDNDDGCHENATCTDDNGSYTCMCQDGFTGDGFNCTGVILIFQN